MARRERRTAEEAGDGFPEIAGTEPSGRLGRGTLLLFGAAVTAVVLGGFLFYSDRNSDRYELRCSRGSAEPRQGLFFPWGTSEIDDETHAPVDLPEGLLCAGARYSSLRDLDAAYATLLLESAERRLSHGGPESLAQAREDVERATRLQGLTEEQQVRAEALLADMVYHEAREILRQVERDLWQARRKLERARALGAGRRIGDLDGWLDFVERETERFRPAPQGGRASDPPPREEDRAPDAGPSEPRGPARHQSSDIFL